MESFDFGLIIKQVRNSLAYFFIGIFFGSAISSFLFLLDENMLEKILNLWFERTTFGVKYFGDYRIWFIANNLFALFMVIISLVIITSIFLRKRKLHHSYFADYENKHPIVTLYSLYMMPVGALLINGAIVSLFLTTILLRDGMEKFSTALSLITPHGLYEFLALILVASYSLSYIQIIKPLVLKKDWKGIKKASKKIFFSNTSMVFIFMIVILVVFGGIIEGSLSLLLK